MIVDCDRELYSQCRFVGILLMNQRLRRVLVIIVPPVMFLIKDVAATALVLSREPGITRKASLYYHVALVPGVLWFGAEGAIVFNLLFGLVLGLCILLSLVQKLAWLIVVPPLAFFCKDTIVITVSVVAAEGGSSRPEPYYSLALLPGSLIQTLGDPILWNVVFGLVVGTVLYLRAVRRGKSMS